MTSTFVTSTWTPSSRRRTSKRGEVVTRPLRSPACCGERNARSAIPVLAPASRAHMRSSGLPKPIEEVAMNADGTSGAIDLGWGTVVVNAKSGVPLGWSAHGKLLGFATNDLVRLDGGFITADGEHSVQGYFVVDGNSVYVASNLAVLGSCTVLVWDFQWKEFTRSLASAPRHCADAPAHDGSWLVEPQGRWHIPSGAFEPFYVSFHNAVSPDGRWLAQIHYDNDDANVGNVTIRDLRSGRTTRSRQYFKNLIEMGTYIRFRANPLRLVVEGYSKWECEVPSLRRCNMLPPAPQSKPPLTSRPHEAQRALLERVVARACYIGSRVLPLEVCESIER